MGVSCKCCCCSLWCCCSCHRQAKAAVARCMLQTCIIKFSCSFADNPAVAGVETNESCSASSAGQQIEWRRGAPGDEHKYDGFAEDVVGAGLLELLLLWLLWLPCQSQFQRGPSPKAELRQTHTCPEVALLGFGAGQDLLLIICNAYCVVFKGGEEKRGILQSIQQGPRVNFNLTRPSAPQSVA